MPISNDTYLPSYEELKVPEINVSFPVLKAASVHMGKYCDKTNREFMLCKSEYKHDARPCLNEGKEVTRCSMEFLQKVKKECNDVFSTYWNCIDRAPKNQLMSCRKYEDAMDQCFKEKIGVSRPEVGYFSKVHIHDSPRPKPVSDMEIPELVKPPPVGDRKPRAKFIPTGFVEA